MKKSLLCIALSIGMYASFSQVNSYAQTYTLGTISGVSGVEFPGDISPCPGIMTFSNIPLGETIDSVRVQYTFFSTMAGFQSVFDQRSYLKCTTTNQQEAVSAVATFNPGFNQPFLYSRLITIANGVVTGPVNFELHAGTVSLIGNSCGGLSHHIYNNSWIMTVYTSGTATCDAPTALNSSNITDTTAQITWTPGGNETSWRIEYGPFPFVPGSGSGSQSMIVNGTPSAALSNLTPLTVYGVYVKALCSSDSSFFSSVLQFNTDSAYCAAPSQLGASNITNTTATLFWTANGGETLWNIQYGTAGFTLGSGTLISLAGSNPWILNGLMGGTSYDFYVQSLCSTTSIGNWAGPHTFLTTSIGLQDQVLSEVKVYPNPVYDILIVECKSTESVSIYDVIGNVVYSTTITSGKNELNLENLLNGVYFISIESRDKPIRIVKI